MFPFEFSMILSWESGDSIAVNIPSCAYTTHTHTWYLSSIVLVYRGVPVSDSARYNLLTNCQLPVSEPTYSQYAA